MSFVPNGMITSFMLPITNRESPSLTTAKILEKKEDPYLSQTNPVQRKRHHVLRTKWSDYIFHVAYTNRAIPHLSLQRESWKKRRSEFCPYSSHKVLVRRCISRFKILSFNNVNKI
ncbi:hypothetical protein CDAR_470991 [Caerostris darwini]|uniref:Ycf15 n=1 Tax=Caerostris darwini TaxID=1538125 RepID=A0AAV4W887_9ARAC|nr:hypothetical protein CDAR_470991 [Caerostris darwini]